MFELVGTPPQQPFFLSEQNTSLAFSENMPYYPEQEYSLLQQGLVIQIIEVILFSFNVHFQIGWRGCYKYK